MEPQTIFRVDEDDVCRLFHGTAHDGPRMPGVILYDNNTRAEIYTGHTILTAETLRDMAEACQAAAHAMDPIKEPEE